MNLETQILVNIITDLKNDNNRLRAILAEFGIPADTGKSPKDLIKEVHTVATDKAAGNKYSIAGS